MSIHVSVCNLGCRGDEHVTRLLRRALSFIPAGVAILSNAGTRMTVSSLGCVSLDPPMVSFALAKDSRRGRAILAGRHFSARLLRDSEDKLTKEEDVADDPGMLDLECMILATYPAGDHHLVLASIHKASMSSGLPLVYWRRGLHGLQPRYAFVASREALEDFITRWEACTLGTPEWTHAGHVAVGAYYAVRFPETAFERTRSGIVRYNESVGISNSDCSGYHETLTRLWSTVLAKVTHGFSDPWMAARYALDILGEERDLHWMYYSFDVARSVAARRNWIAPDLTGPF